MITKTIRKIRTNTKEPASMEIATTLKLGVVATRMGGAMVTYSKDPEAAMKSSLLMEIYVGKTVKIT